MKVKAMERTFYMLERKTGKFIPRKPNEQFEMDEDTEREEIYSMLQMGRITIIDEKFIPLSWRYTVIYWFIYKNENGQTREATPGKEIMLSQEIACKFLTSGHIVPVDPDGWRPRNLLGPTVKEDKIKKMFDDPPEQKENWITRR